MCLGGGGGSSAPETPKEIREFYTFLKEIGADQYETAKTKYGPLEDKMIDEINRFQTPEYAEEQANIAASDVTKAFGDARTANDQRLASYGIDPGQGRARSAKLSADLAEAGTMAGARTGARRTAELQGFNALAGAAGRGDAKVATAVGAAQSGGQLAQSAHNSNIQQQQWNQQQSNAGLAGIGQLAGTVGTLAFLSTKKSKDRGGDYKGGLKAVEKMPVEKFRYKAGIDDGSKHVGPMAEEFTKATGLGDGKTINVADAHGITLSAVKELSAKVSALEAGKKKMKRGGSSDPTSEANQPEGAAA